MKKIFLCSLVLIFLQIKQLQGVELSNYKLLINPYLTSSRTLPEFKNVNAFTLLLKNGQLFSYGDNGLVAPHLPDDFTVSQIYSSVTAFAVLSTKGEVISWGDQDNGGRGAPTNMISTEPNSIVSNFTGFLARCSDGTLAEWGSLPLSPDVQEAISSGKKVKQLYAGHTVFIALLEDPNTQLQTLYSWGYNQSDPNESLNKKFEISTATTVKTVVTTCGAVAALLTDGTLLPPWGNSSEGGAIPEGRIPQGEKIKSIVAGEHAFAALSEAGLVYGWGNVTRGGFSPILPDKTTATEIYANDGNFSGVLSNTNIVVWGQYIDKDPTTQKNEKVIPMLKTSEVTGVWSPEETNTPNNINCVVPNGNAFAAITTDRTGKTKGVNRILTWGKSSEAILPTFVTSSTKAIKSIIPCQGSFTVLYQDGTIQSWGDWADGETAMTWTDDKGQLTQTPPLPKKADGTSKKVTALVSNLNAYMALLEDGSLFYWGGACSMASNGIFQPSLSFSYGQSISTPSDTSPLWFASPFVKYIFNE